MSIWQKIRRSSRLSNKSAKNAEFSEITIHREANEPITFRGILLSDHDVSGEGYTLEMRLYALEGRRVILETKYQDAHDGIHHTLEFENPAAAVKHIKQLKETIILNKKRFMALMQ
jgi:hypothetical protein